MEILQSCTKPSMCGFCISHKKFQRYMRVLSWYDPSHLNLSLTLCFLLLFRNIINSLHCFQVKTGSVDGTPNMWLLALTVYHYWFCKNLGPRSQRSMSSKGNEKRHICYYVCIDTRHIWRRLGDLTIRVRDTNLKNRLYGNLHRSFR